MSKQPVENNAELVYHDTAHNTFMMLDSDGRLIYQVKDGSAPVIVEPAQVIALYQFLRRPTVELTVMHAMRRWLEASSPEGAEIMALIDKHLPPLPPIVPLVRMERFEGEPDIDGSIIKGWYFNAGEGQSQVEFYFPDRRGEFDFPIVYLLNGKNAEPEELDQMLPNLIAVLSDPRVIEARRRVAAGLPALPLAREFGSAA